jgi:hypothetical protein
MIYLKTNIKRFDNCYNVASLLSACNVKLVFRTAFLWSPWARTYSCKYHVASNFKESQILDAQLSATPLTVQYKIRS